MYTIKAFMIRVYANDYRPYDLGIDGLILEQVCYVIMYFYYIFGMQNPFDASDFLWGCLLSLMLLVAKQTLCIAYAIGPGGPVNAISTTQSLVQVILDVFVEHQNIGPWGLSGFAIGIIATLVIALGNMCVKKFIKKEHYVNSPIKRLG